MKVRDVMTKTVVRIHPDEPVEVAARTLAHYNIGAMPVCGSDGRVCGMVTDRDLVTRCLASGKRPGAMTVKEVMTGRVVAAGADMELGAASYLMGKEQVRRLPVIENGKLCGMLSIGDLAKSEDEALNAADALTEITSNVSQK